MYIFNLVLQLQVLFVVNLKTGFNLSNKLLEILGNIRVVSLAYYLYCEYQVCDKTSN